MFHRQSEEWPIQLRASSVSKITTKASSQQINENNGHKGSLPLDKMDIIFHDGVKGINYIKKGKKKIDLNRWFAINKLFILETS